MRLCEVDGCQNKHLARGYCRKHYQSEYRRKQAAASPDSGEHPWQRTAHVLWFGSDLPEDYREQIARFEELNHADGWQVRVWDEQAVLAEGLTHQDLFQGAADIVPTDSVYQFMSDLARLEILHRHGGFYFDADTVWQKPITPLLAQAGDGQLLTVWERQWRYVANGYIYAPPGHQVLASAIKTVPNWVNARRPNARANRITGPGGQWTHLCRQRRKDVLVLDQNHLIPVPWAHPEWVTERPYPDAYGIHSWGHQRLLRGLA